MKCKIKKEEIPFIKILNARAYLACCLTLCEAQNESGYAQYIEVINDAIKEFGEWDARTIGFYCYFGLHFVQIKDWTNAHKHIDYILSVDGMRDIEYFEKNVINDLLMDYFQSIIKLSDQDKNAFLNEFG